MTKRKKVILIGTIAVILLMIFICGYLILLVSDIGLEDGNREQLFSDHYEDFVCIKDMIIEHADQASDTGVYRKYTYEGKASVDYHAHQRDEQTERQNKAIGAIEKAFGTDDLNKWEYDGKTVLVHDVYQSYRFEYYIDGKKPAYSNEKKINLGHGWYYFRDRF